MNLTGSLQTRTFEDRNGNKRTATEVLAREVDFCGPKAVSTGMTAPSATPVKSAPLNAFDADDDLPF